MTLPTRTTVPAFSTRACRPLLLVAVLVLTTLCLAATPAPLHAHGSVVDEGDACVIQFGFYSAHFSIFQPHASAHQGFCEDIPEAGESVFVMEYRHDSMRQVPLEFRLIRNNSGLGRFVRWQDIETMPDEQLRADTVFRQSLPPQPDGVVRVMHHFDTPGDFIGIVSIPHPTEDMLYHAVFPFRVGASVWSNWPLGLPVLALLWLAIRRVRRKAHWHGADHETV